MIRKEKAAINLASKQPPEYDLIPIFKTNRKRILYFIGTVIDKIRGHQQLFFQYHDGYEKIYTGKKKSFELTVISFTKMSFAGDLAGTQRNF
ncbi:MAG: hypothetical protein ACJAWV_001945 [Flammeovirgaceae bacterium]|jgi:hypothetical protein